jgi:hypothetical protein
MRGRIVIGIIALAIIALLIWKFACQEEPRIVAIMVDAAHVAPPPDAAPDATPPAPPDAAPAHHAAAEPAERAPSKPKERSHRRSAEAAEPKEAPAPPVAVAAGPPPETPDAAPSLPPPAPIAQKPDAEALEPAPKPVERKKGSVVVHHHNGMSGSFHLVRIVDSLDGVPVFERSAPPGGSLDEPKDLEAPTISATLGQHSLTVRLEYTAASRGVFTYAEGYKYRVNANYTFTVNPDHQTEVTVKGYEKGNLNTPLADKPAVEFQSKSR